MYYIGEFSKMGRTTIKTLHYYDRIGLLQPEEVDPSTGYRLYTTNQLFELHRIQSLRQAGLSVDSILAIKDGADARPLLEERLDEVARELREREEQHARIAYILSKKEKEFIMDYQATIKEIPSHIIYSKQLTVPNHQAYFEVIPAIGRAVADANPGLKCAVPEYCYITNLDGEYKETDISIEYCEAVTSKGKEVDGIVFKETEPLTVVSVFHKGSYLGIPQAYAFTMDWIEKNGYKINGLGRESYIDGVWNSKEESDWLTEIQVPVEKK